jgi:uncharacterized membrane protein (UPF0127 family)
MGQGKFNTAFKFRALDHEIFFHYDEPAMMLRWVIVLLICIAPALIAADEQTHTRTIRLPSGKQITAEVADTPSKRMLGLMFRDQLPEGHGMLFFFDQEDFHGIWMKNCRIPLDILWLDQKQRVTHLEENVPPCQDDPCHIYYPAQKALYVLELNTGAIEKEKIRLGIQVQF